MEKKGNYFSEGEVQVISSSHNDIAFLDTPLATILFRNKNVIGKAISLLEEDSAFYHTIENSLYIKDFLLLNPEMEGRLAKVMSENRLACGATYTQLYETSVTSEGLVRQYYLGKRWLEKRFPGFRSRTTWNQDVPARAMQSAQVMKKCGVDYLFVSRMNAGFFRWYSPDGSCVQGYCTGHYHQNSISRIIDLSYSAYDEDTRNAEATKQENHQTTPIYDKQGHAKLFKYLEDAAENRYKPNAIPPFFGFLAIRDYDYPLDLNGYFKGIEADKELEFPPFSHATAESFMDVAVDLLDKDSYWDIYRGERPNLWIYHEICHSQAFWYNRNGLNTIDEDEILACILRLLQIGVAYPSRDIRHCWEQLLYLDHGWGGCNGNVTDETYLQISKKGYEHAFALRTNLLETLAGHIQIREDGNYLVVFNASAWERYDRVECLLDWQQLHTIDFSLVDDNDEIVEYQIVSEPAPYTIQILFMAKVPAFGYVQYRIGKRKGDLQASPFQGDVHLQGKHRVIVSNDYYHLTIEDGGCTEIYDKDLDKNLLDTNNLLKGFEVFMLDSSGNGSGEFSEIQQPNLQYGQATEKYGCMTGYVNSSSNYGMVWRIQDHEGLNTPVGPVATIVEGEAHFPHFTLIQQIIIYNKMKKIETKVSIEAWDGTMYREIRMALPLAPTYGELRYEVPMGILKQGLDEVQGSIGTKPFVPNVRTNFPTVLYPTDCREIHPREVQSWIGVEGDNSTVLLSCVDTPTFDYVNCSTTYDSSTGEPFVAYNIQPILLASRHSCFQLGGNPYHQRGSHHFAFSFTSANGGLQKNVRSIEGEKHRFSTYVSYDEKRRKGLPIIDSCVQVIGDARISGMKKAEDSDELVIRLYEPFGKTEKVTVSLGKHIKSVRKSDMLEYGGKQEIASRIDDELSPYAIETYCVQI